MCTLSERSVRFFSCVEATRQKVVHSRVISLVWKPRDSITTATVGKYTFLRAWVHFDVEKSCSPRGAGGDHVLHRSREYSVLYHFLHGYVDGSTYDVDDAEFNRYSRKGTYKLLATKEFSRHFSQRLFGASNGVVSSYGPHHHRVIVNAFEREGE